MNENSKQYIEKLKSEKEWRPTLDEKSKHMRAMLDQIGGSHYKDMAIQPAEYIHKNGIGFLAGNAIKYVSRYKAKNGKQDLEKAIHCIQLLIEAEYGNAD